MPFIQIAVPAGESADVIRSIANSVHDALVETIKMPPTDRFQIITEHAPERLIADPAYLGVQRSARVAFIHITLRAGRTPDMKRALYAAIVRHIHERTDWRREDILITLAENHDVDWSFGNGEAQYAT